ncbi:D-hexose-6-phosphate mutarotase [Marinobacter sp. CHS3-4]|uniref:D-hexose-6-phosphate mutarotase n=1 Tax=Marinobacter sp. CHS3-4 TaxID=3045174 RepID=UPI0024B5B8E8|nr:D-hexose-6-phosphate mutarotase [Marinobacter sp. CHS3-4]MDI9245557.1 D-hexose-6-phosphate mutarotase [Marinobacter sp. CHS3-4]
MTTKPGIWSFTRWATVGQLEAIEIRHPLFKARIFLQGAHLTQFAPDGEPNWLWMSERACFKPGHAIRGGIPMCWPWFGVPDKNPPEVRRRISTGASHGIARTALWKLEDVRETAREVEVSLSLHANRDFAEAWTGNALCLATFTFNENGCQIGLTTTNLDPSPLALSQALHTYLPTSDIHSTRILGLDGADYVDTLENWADAVQQGEVSFSGETDRIYASGNALTVLSPDQNRILTPVGSESTVVWNPGPDKAKTLSDFPDDAWQNMLCVETANALSDYRVLNEGQSHTIGVMLGQP